jgi:sulfatase maturation enzyme AslB (radical SAM superfamily)
LQAQKTDLYAKDRVSLYKKIPLNTPFAVNIEPSSYCNIACSYCIHSLLKQDMEKESHIFGFMPDERYERALDQLAEFPEKIKMVSFGGIGEPTMHKKLPEMVKSLRRRDIANKITLITNGILLTEELSLALIDAGLDIIKISLQGLSAEAYYKSCNKKINWEEFMKRLSFLFRHRGNCSIRMKIADIALAEGDKKKNEDLFYETFGNICDMIAIEHIVPCFPELDYTNIIKGERHLSRYNYNHEKIAKVCSQLFFRLNIWQSGKVTICTFRGLGTENMHMDRQTLVQIWNGRERMTLQRHNLLLRYDILDMCKTCSIRNDFAYPEDILDDHVDEIYAKLESANSSDE